MISQGTVKNIYALISEATGLMVLSLGQNNECVFWLSLFVCANLGEMHGECRQWATQGVFKSENKLNSCQSVSALSLHSSFLTSPLSSSPLLPLSFPLRPYYWTHLHSCLLISPPLLSSLLISSHFLLALIFSSLSSCPPPLLTLVTQVASGGDSNQGQVDIFSLNRPTPRAVKTFQVGSPFLCLEYVPEPAPSEEGDAEDLRSPVGMGNTICAGLDDGR